MPNPKEEKRRTGFIFSSNDSEMDYQMDYSEMDYGPNRRTGHGLRSLCTEFLHSVEES